MADRCDYEAAAWHVARTLEAHGDSLTPAWPASDIPAARQGSCLGCEREGHRTETYSVSFIDAKTKEKLSCTTDASRWSSLKNGTTWDGSVSRVTNAIDCDSLKPH
jgi:hypothetical protein